MPSLEPGIHVADAGTGGSVAGRVEPGHDAEGETAIRLFCNEPLVVGVVAWAAGNGDRSGNGMLADSKTARRLVVPLRPGGS